MSLPTTQRPPHGPPQLRPLVEALCSGEVRFVVTGSVAAWLHGIDLQPGDLDVCPAPDADNLQRLTQVLSELDAVPADFGHWETDALGERRWIVEQLSEAERAAWRADPQKPDSFDHLFLTRLGDLDIVPSLTGEYGALLPRSVRTSALGPSIRCAGVNDLLATLTRPRRDKDVERVAGLRQQQRRPAPRQDGSGPEAASPVSLKVITSDNLGAVLKLSVAAEQRCFVADNAVSLAQAGIESSAWPRAVYAADTAVGFVMLELTPETQEAYLWRFMIDARFQGRGFGGQALKLLVDHVRTLPGVVSLVTSVVQAEGGPQAFYESMGFAATGEFEEGEALLQLRL